MYDNLVAGYEGQLGFEDGLSDLTITAYGGDVRQFLAVLGEKPLTTESVMQFARSFDSDSTQQRKLSAVKGFLGFLIQQHVAGLNQAFIDRLDSIKTARRKPRPLCLEAITTMKDSAGHAMPGTRGTLERTRAIILMLADSGMRVSELCGLTLRSVSMADKTARVFGKGRVERMVVLTDEAIEALQTYIAGWRARHADPKCDAMFITRSGLPLDRFAITKLVSQLARESGVPAASAHTLRHTFATQLMNQGLDLQRVSDLMGHASLGVTQMYLGTDDQRLMEVYRSAHPMCQDGG